MSIVFGAEDHPLMEALDVSAEAREYLGTLESLSALGRAMVSIEGHGVEEFNSLAARQLETVGVSVESQGDSLALESVSEVIGKLRSMLKGGDFRKKENEYDFSERMQEELEKTYLNKEWLDSKELVDGQISANDFGYLLAYGRSVPSDVFSRIEKAATELLGHHKKWLSLYHSHAKDLAEVYKKAKNGDPEKAFDQVMGDVADLEKAAENKLKVPVDKIPGNYELNDKSDATASAVVGPNKAVKVKKLPALSKEEILKAGELIKQLIETEQKLNELEDEFGALSSIDADDELSYWDKHIDADKISDTKAEKMLDRLDLNMVPGPLNYDFIGVSVRIAKALDMWASRSIK